MSDFILRQGDTGWTIPDTLKDENGNPVDLAGASVRFKITPIGGGAAKIDSAATRDQVGTGSDGSKGKVHYTSATATDSDTPGNYLGSWIVTFGGGQVQTFPNGGYILFTVTPTAPTSAGRYLTLEELKQSLRLTGKDFADADLELAIEAASRGLEESYGTQWVKSVDPDTRYYDSRGGRRVLLGDVLRIDTIALDYWAGQYGTTLDPTQYRLLPPPPRAGLTTATPVPGNGEPYRYLELQRNYTPYWGGNELPRGDATVRITGLFGWEKVPAGVKVATTIIASRLVRRSREAPFGIISFGPEAAALRAQDIARDPEVTFAMEAISGPKSLVR